MDMQETDVTCSNWAGPLACLPAVATYFIYIGYAWELTAHRFYHLILFPGVFLVLHSFDYMHVSKSAHLLKAGLSCGMPSAGCTSFRAGINRGLFV